MGVCLSLLLINSSCSDIAPDSALVGQFLDAKAVLRVDASAAERPLCFFLFATPTSVESVVQWIKHACVGLSSAHRPLTARFTARFTAPRLET